MTCYIYFRTLSSCRQAAMLGRVFSIINQMVWMAHIVHKMKKIEATFCTPVVINPLSKSGQLHDIVCTLGVYYLYYIIIYDWNLAVVVNISRLHLCCILLISCMYLLSVSCCILTVFWLWLKLIMIVLTVIWPYLVYMLAYFFMYFYFILAISYAVSWLYLGLFDIFLVFWPYLALVWLSNLYVGSELAVYSLYLGCIFKYIGLSWLYLDCILTTS